MVAPADAKAEELMDEVCALPEDDRREFAQELLVKLAIDTDVLEAWYDEAVRYPCARLSKRCDKVAGIGTSSRQVIAIGRSPSCFPYRTAPRNAYGASGSARTKR
jgi:hypothetical protein